MQAALQQTLTRTVTGAVTSTIATTVQQALASALGPRMQESLQGAAKEAILKETQSFLNAGGTIIIDESAVPSGKQILRRRLVLTLKEICERGLSTGSRKAKSRIVILGFEDVRAVAHAVLDHRVVLNFAAVAAGADSATIVDAVLAEVSPS